MSDKKMTRRNACVSPLAGWATVTELPDGRTVQLGDEITVEGEGRFRLKRIRPNGELTCWGTIGSAGVVHRGAMRTFKPEQVKVIHRKNRMQDTLRAEEV